MTDSLSGREPALTGAPLEAITGSEPMLGGERFTEQWRAHLLERLHDPHMTHYRRLNAGRWLADSGDDRAGIGLTDDGLPDILWQLIPAGVAHIGDRHGHDESFMVERFYMAAYPVTWAQYRVFLTDENGHRDPQWWADLHRREEYDRQAPPLANYPAQEVSWYDAVACCRWLSARSGVQVRLPTEWEWQHAANGGDPTRIFPWGQRWNAQYANTRESRLRQVTAVGMYPHAESMHGVLDLCGTVLEWCSNLYADPANTNLHDPRERVLRGGSWFLIKDYAHTFFRTGYDPYNRYHSVGFRLVTGDPRPQPAETDHA
ncbi:MAG: formylglycine-generating enzyme family protein [Anaerolineae bacterium]